ncbi:alpha/beta hydrolase [Telmatospirillum siberiense]|uniref:Alpha/beta hydrolase n=1 Tax=Telmatospirillum siberiense TaxID=382514 RepID=A0A2N3PXU5_9PROT|nr:alpha/beta hydrolase [Telmatospirillum siberiense]PKU25234.1 alpha/beta hydrolase [Telmatospirillum siberiense]
MTIRRAAVLMIGLSLAACTPTVKLAGPPVTSPALADDAIVTADEMRLPLRAWTPSSEPWAVVIALHGFNDYGFAFDEPGKALAEHGIAVYAYDQRGFGAAPNRGYWAGETTMSADLSAAVRLIGARHPGKPLYLLGESMGGAVVMVTMARPDAPPVAGIILSAPAVWGRDSMGFLQRGALWFTSHAMPWLTLTGRGLNIMPSDNIEMLRRLSADPLIIKETRVDAIHGLCDLMDHAAEVGPLLHVPTLALYGDKDEVVPAEPTFRVFKALPKDPVPPVRAFYPNGYHMLLRDLQAKVVLDDIASWIRNRQAPLPSEADRHALDRLAEAAKD